MLDVNLIVFPLNLRAKFRRPALSAPQNANLSAEILQILGLNLARKFDTGLPTRTNLTLISKILNLHSSLNQTFAVPAFWGFFDRLAHLLVKFDFVRR